MSRQQSSMRVGAVALVVVMSLASAILTRESAAQGTGLRSQSAAWSQEPAASAVVNLTDVARAEAAGGHTATGPRAVHRPMPRPARLSAPPGVLLPETAPAPGAEAPASGATLPASPPPLASFQALDDNNASFPPDVSGAVGLTHLMTTLNSQVRVQSRSGEIVSTVSLRSFWGPTGAAFPYDPRALYDPFANRWLVSAGADPFSASASVLIGVSQTGDPTGKWSLYRFDADPSRTQFADYPVIGFNKDWAVIQANMFTNGGNFAGSKIFVIAKSALYAGGGVPSARVYTDPHGFTQVPAITYDNSLAAVYLVETWNGSSSGSGVLRVSTITGPVGSEVYTAGVSFPSTPNPWSDFPALNFAPQLGSTTKIATDDDRMGSVVYRNGALWMTHTVFLPAGSPTRSAVQWWQVSPAGSVLQSARIDDPTGAMFYAYPSIAVNKNNDALVGYSRFSATQYASANYSFRAGTDAPNTLRADSVLKTGEAPYYKADPQDGINRWGDYSSTVVDPADDTTLWTLQEYAATPSGGSYRWGTWWGLVSAPANRSRIFADFNGDGKADILWRHTSGTLYTWFMNGANIGSDGSPGSGATDWTIRGLGDFNGDGKADVLWRHTSGALYTWFMNGAVISGGGSPGGASSDWTIQGVGDFNGDGKADILWRHNISGEVIIWLMNGTSVIGTASLGSPTTDWTIQGVGDFNGDGKADILWRHSSGALYTWFMNGAVISGGGSPGGASSDWTIQGVGDFNGDGKADILWRHTFGEVIIWLMNGTSVVGTGSLGSPTTDWTIQGVGDFNGDGKADILWRHTSGEVIIWLLNGTSVVGTGSPGGATSDWQIQ